MPSRATESRERSAAEAPQRSIILFYKSLTVAGGAERLFAQEYAHLKSLGFRVYVVTRALNRDALFGVDIPASDLILLSRRVPASIALATVLLKHRHTPVLCSSGHIDVFLACTLTCTRYALHIHHPNFMSFNDYDKFSIFMRRHLRQYLQSNFGAAQFADIEQSLTAWQWVSLNFRALLSLWATRRARCRFVLSNYARREKQDLYGVDCDVLMGALPRNYDERLCRMRTVRPRLLQDGTVHICTMARLDRNKRLDELLYAVALLRSSGKDVRLAVAGDGPERITLEALARELKLEGAVSFLGFLPDESVEQFFASSHLFVSIDWADYKLTMFEALSYGLPCIVSTETEFSIDLAKAGLVRAVEPSAPLVAEAISEMAAGNADLNALEPALRAFTWHKYFSQIAARLSSAGMWPARTLDGTASLQTRHHAS